MARSHVMRPITGSNGDMLYGARVLVSEAGLSVPIAQPIYAFETGDQTLANPYVAVSGMIDFWLDEPQRVNVLVTADGHSDIRAYLDAAPAPVDIARTETPLLITGDQVPGRVLLAGDTDGQAVWGDAPTNSGVTPLVSVINVDFAASTDPSGWAFTMAANTSRAYVPEVPLGQGLQHSLYSSHTGASGSLAIVSPGFTLTEPGYVAMWMRPNLGTGEQIVISVTNQVGAKTVLETITGARPWGFYRYTLAAATYQSMSVEFTGATTFTGSGHEMWVADFRIVYGGQVPAHSHSGAGAGSVALGPSSTATAAGAVSVGSGATGSGVNAVAAGYHASGSGLESVAVGANTAAGGSKSVALGSGATGNLGVANWTAIGTGTYVDAANGTAIGQNAKVYASDGTAIGSGAYVGSSGAGAVAIGQGAQALAPASMALGPGAVTGATHSGSVAIGQNAATSAAGQTMLGDPSNIWMSVVVGGKLYALSAVNLGTDATSRLGFFGSEGTIKPTVTGSDGGVLALRNLIAALTGLGLVTNSTTTS